MAMDATSAANPAMTWPNAGSSRRRSRWRKKPATRSTNSAAAHTPSSAPPHTAGANPAKRPDASSRSPSTATGPIQRTGQSGARPATRNIGSIRLPMPTAVSPAKPKAAR